MYFTRSNFFISKNIYENNRVSEEIQKDDLKKGDVELTLQRIFQLIYGWQDRLMAADRSMDA